MVSHEVGIYPDSDTVGSYSFLEISCEGCSKLSVLRVAGREFSCVTSSDLTSVCSLKVDVAGHFYLSCILDSIIVPCGTLSVHNCPELASLTPARSLIGHQYLVTIFGHIFIRTYNLSGTSWSRHHYGDHLLSRAVWLSMSSISCMVPSTIIGNITVHVSNDGVYKCPSFVPHAVALPPSVLKLSPSSSSHLGGLAVTTFGNGFSGHASGLLCVFGDISALANVVNNSVAVCVTVAHSVGRVLLSVGVDGSIDLSVHVSFDFTSSSVHFCDSVTPNVVSAHGPSSVTIFGRGCNSYSVCRISQMLIEPKMTNSTTVFCLLDVLSVGRYSLDVLNSDTNFVCDGI